MSSKEIITDEMRSFIGLESDPVTYVVEKHSIEHFARAIGESNPIYFDEQFAKDNVGGIIAPPTFIRLFRPKRLEKQLCTNLQQNSMIFENRQFWHAAISSNRHPSNSKEMWVQNARVGRFC